MSDVYNGGDSMAQFDPNNYATKEDLENNGKGVFWATYNETSRDDILDAFLHGKIIALKENLSSGAVNTAFMLERTNNDTLEFCTAINPNNSDKYIYYSVNSSNTWSKEEKKVGGDVLLVEFNSVPGLGWQADKTFNEINTALNSGKIVFGITNPYKEGLITSLYKEGFIVTGRSEDPTDGYIRFACPQFREFHSSGIGQLKNNCYGIFTIKVDNTVVQRSGFVIGQKYSFLATPFNIDRQDMTFALASNASYFILNNNISNANLSITIISEYGEGSPDTDITIVSTSGNISNISVLFLTADGTVSVNPMPPADLAAVLSSGTYFGIRITGYFWTITKLIS